MPSKAPLLDAFDREILVALHEFEYDPARHQHRVHRRISPVPLYLVYAATTPLSKRKVDGQHHSTSGPDSHARIEGLRTLGYVRSAERHWPEFGVRATRDGRFIAVDSKRRDRPRPSLKQGAEQPVLLPSLEYHVSFGYLSDLEAALENAGYPGSQADHIAIWESVLKKFRHLSWRFYYEAPMREWYESAGIPYRDDTPHYGDCYTLTAKGVTAARAASQDLAGPTGSAASDGSRGPGTPANVAGPTISEGEGRSVPDGPTDPAPSVQPAAQEPENVFQLRGEVWKLRYRGQEAMFPHSPRSGLLYIRELILNQGRALVAIDLDAIARGESRRGPASPGMPVLDDQARLAFRKRYSDLSGELEEAQRNRDEGRVLSAQNEMDQLKAQVKSSFGLGGRRRQMGDELEKAARRVAMAITRAIQQIEKHLPDLALHIRKSLETGQFMCYRPESSIPWLCT